MLDNEITEKINSYLENNKQEIIENICNLVKIPSVSDESKAEENMPFGEECNNALEYALALGKSLGFRTKNIDGYCGYIEFGEGEELIGIIGHLDVVPADKTDWKKTKPFEPKVENNKIYGRGTFDDKGPVVAALYAMKAVKDTTKINKRVRLILGLNEEKGWKCINYYKKVEEHPNLGFSPDADFPCIYAEKGIVNVFIETSLNNQKEIIIKNVDCKKNAMNVVPKYCKTELQIGSESLEIETQGISSHSAHPELGKNAIAENMKELNRIFNEHGVKNDVIEFFDKYINDDYNGNLLEINNKDESGELTLNLARIELTEENVLKIGLNLRIPINTSIEEVKNKFLEKAQEFENLEITFKNEMKPLYMPKDSKLVTTLTDIFNKISGQNEDPIAIGGATYARAFSNCVSFGTNMPGQKDMCHQADEFIDIDNIILSAKIYAEAIKKLGE